jgi:maltokinase
VRAPDRSLEQALADWLPRQRWFAGKGRPIDAVQIAASTELVAGDPALRHVLAEVRQGPDTDRYQLLLGGRDQLTERLRYAEICHADGRYVYDAAHDPELTRVLLTHLAADATAGPLAFHKVAGTEIETGHASLASTAEQSNTSLVFGDAYIYKLFRRISPGVNPDLELNLALTEAGCPHIPQLFGWVEMDLGPDIGQAVLAMMSEYLSSGTDGWQLATTSVRDLYGSTDMAADQAGGDFSAEAGRLGAATARVHRELAGTFGVSELPVEEIGHAAERMREQLATACADVPELVPFAPAIEAAFQEFAELDRPLPVQRIHGDYHLGQVLRTDRGWMLLDFEGEPARTLAERQAPGHPLRDVAGMLRSFEYAARFLLVGHGNQAVDVLEGRAREWADRNRQAFCRGYSSAGGPDPDAQLVLLRAFELDKAVYEVRYEARNRPAWLHVPLSSLSSIM